MKKQMFEVGGGGLVSPVCKTVVREQVELFEAWISLAITIEFVNLGKPFRGETTQKLFRS